VPEPLYQEPGTRYSRAIPYELHAHAHVQHEAQAISLSFENTGGVGVVFHVYDLMHLDRIPRRYTVEAGKSLNDEWDLGSDAGIYNLEVHGPNGFLRAFKGTCRIPEPELRTEYRVSRRALQINVRNLSDEAVIVSVCDNAYKSGGPWVREIRRHEEFEQAFSIERSGCWYDFTISTPHRGDYQRRVAGRMETGDDGFSDPASAIGQMPA
jgi:phospholipase C